MAVNSRRKGARNERDIAKVLEEWTNKKFSKTPASGGLQWKTSMTKGDVVCTTEGHYFPFCIEGKFYASIDFGDLFNPGIIGCDILKWWRQCRTDAEKCNKVPMLLMRYNRLPGDFWFMVLPTDFYRSLNIFGRLLNIRKVFNYQDKTTEVNFTLIYSKEFFKLDYKAVKKVAKKYIKERTA